jgi:hypothetical protein
LCLFVGGGSWGLCRRPELELRSRGEFRDSGLLLAAPEEIKLEFESEEFLKCFVEFRRKMIIKNKHFLTPKDDGEGSR